MSTKRGGWISRRGQPDAAAAIDQVIERQQPGEQVQMIPDERIVDSPYQARRPFDAQSIEDLAQGMRETGFQGVLVTRPHSDPVQRRHGVVQLVYGHRRRIAWHKVCMERGELCILPVVVREMSDEQMLTIGAQENLQRQDLDPIEEAQIVAWHERMFFNKNQTEIGAMLGKSVDWIKTRSRVHKLPDALKERLRARPRAMSQMLELGGLYAQQPELAITLADRVVTEHMTLDTLRAALRNYERPIAPIREERHNQSGATPIEHKFTNDTTERLEQPRDTLADQSAVISTLQVGTPANSVPRSAPSVRPTEHGAGSPTPGSPAWLPTLCDSLTQATQALRERRDSVATLDGVALAQFQGAIEDLLLELALVADTLQRPR